MPPEQLIKAVSNKCNTYFDMIADMVYKVVSTFTQDERERKNKVLAFTMVMEDLFSELL